MIIATNIGFQLNCKKKDCPMSAHLLCAYLNGIYFELSTLTDEGDSENEKEYKLIKSDLYCLSHTPNYINVFYFYCQFLIFN